MPKVLNKLKDGIPAGSVYVGRPSKWGNPFLIGKDGHRNVCVRKYAAWVVKQRHLMAALHELRGKDLVCWCAPEPCHGDVLLQLANNESVKP